MVINNPKLVEEYPSLQSIIGCFETPGVYKEIKENASVRITVQRMDENFLFFTGDTVFGNSFLFREGGDDKPDLAGSRYESVIAVGTGHDIIQARTWAPKSAWRVKNFMIETGVGTIWYLVKTSKYVWHRFIKGRDDCRGEVLQMEFEITIYLPPKGRSPIKKLLEEARYEVHATICMRELVNGILRKDADALRVSAILSDLAKDFELRVYNSGLRSQIDKSKSRGMSGIFSGIKMMTYVCAGRVKMTLERGENQITFMAAEDGKPWTGVDSLNGTIPAVKGLVETVARLFDDDLNMVYKELKDDDKVSVF